MQNQTIDKDGTIAVSVNGEQKRLRAASVRGLLAALEYEGSFFAVAVNRSVVPRARWDERLLKDGDAIEIVTPRQGG